MGSYATRPLKLFYYDLTPIHNIDASGQSFKCRCFRSNHSTLNIIHIDRMSCGYCSNTSRFCHSQDTILIRQLILPSVDDIHTNECLSS